MVKLFMSTFNDQSQNSPDSNLMCEISLNIGCVIFVVLFAQKPSNLGPNGPNIGWDFTYGNFLVSWKLLFIELAILIPIELVTKDHPLMIIHHPLNYGLQED